MLSKQTLEVKREGGPTDTQHEGYLFASEGHVEQVLRVL